MELLVQALVAIAVVVIVVALVGRFVRVVTIHDYERGVRFARGRLTGLVGTGTHVSVRPFSEIRLLDGRPMSVVLEGQEVMTADGVPVKVSLVARYVLGDPVAAITGDADYQRAMYLRLQLALREALAGRTLGDGLAARGAIGPAVREACASDLATLGLELLAVDVRDLMVPGELKRAFAGVIAARKEAEATLERARGETGALRNLANAGRMVEENPGLLQLRIVQQLGASSGNTVVLGLPDGTASPASAAVPRRGRRAVAPDRDEPRTDGTGGG